MKNVVAISGGLASAIMANSVLSKIDDNAELVFTDTKWEDPDLYRFLDDLESYWGIEITRLSDGRNPEQLFYDEGILGSNRVPICSRLLKAKILQEYVKKYDSVTVYFGIDLSEEHRAPRITNIYDQLKVYTRFPLIEKRVFSNKKQFAWEVEENWGIVIPRLYREGFPHNNCNGGCVRQGEKYWKHLLRIRPAVFEDRARIEREFKNGKYTFMKKMSLDELREREESQMELSIGRGNVKT